MALALLSPPSPDKALIVVVVVGTKKSVQYDLPWWVKKTGGRE
jgi:hypothetical protein